MSRADELFNQALRITPDVLLEADGKIHESCFRAWGLYELARTLLNEGWPHDAILLTLKLTEHVCVYKYAQQENEKTTSPKENQP